ncbi:MAG: hypothetical protein R6V33_05890 [Pelovirga sp.]
MRPLTPFVVFMSLVVIGSVLLFWFGMMFKGYLQPADALIVDNPQPQRISAGSNATFHLTGSGFDRDTQVSLVMDVSNQDMVIQRYPLDGFFNASLIIDDLLLLGSNDGLKVLSIADPESPRLLETYLSGRSVLDLHYADGRLFVSCGRLGLAVMSLQNKQLAIRAEVWTGDITTTSYFYAGHLYVNTYAGGLLVYKVNESMQIRQIGRLDHENVIRGMAFYEDRLFVYDRHGMLSLYDCSNPQELRYIGDLRFDSMVRSVLVQGARLHVALPDSLQIFDLADPDQPHLVRTWDDFASIRRLIEGQGHIYLVDNSLGMRILDSRNLSMTAHMAFAEGLQTLAEGDNVLYATGSLEGLLTIDREHLRPRQATKWIDGLLRVNGGLVNDDIFYLSGTSGVALVKKDEGRVQAFAEATERAMALLRYRDLIITLLATDGIKIFDVSIADNPQLAAHWPQFSANGIQMVGNFLVSSSPRTGLRVIDINDLTSFKIIDEQDAPQIVAMAAEGEYLFCVTYEQGLLTYRVHSNGTLQQLNHMLPPFPMGRFDQQLDIDIHNDIAYIANGRSGLLIVDVKNPANPQLVSTLGLPGYSKGIRFNEDLVYLVTLRDGVLIVDVAEPKRPFLVGSLPLSRVSKFLLIDEGLLYFFQDANGMSAIPLPRFAQQTNLQPGNRLEVMITMPTYPGRYNLQISSPKGLINHHAVFDLYE